MTVMIGIHQQQDKVDKLCENLGLRAIPLAAVGPFPTKNEALAWQQAIRRKIGDCQVIEMAGTEDRTTPWYGFTFEQ
ncbi:SPOR domain-containing protein [Desulfobulbus elongatus]|uniref:SPOR domain-containing protein n=1 Tax=Desulfobulbus elongatus TaxID=53332 RepID=UPI000486A090|nr:SPOR domain-containing protein [Desulfobulbus elongatus]